MGFATQEETKGQEQVLALDPHNQAPETATLDEEPAVEQATEAQSAVQTDQRPPELSMPAIQDRSTYLVGDEIRVPTEVAGKPQDSVRLTIVARLSGADTVSALVPLQLSDSGHGHHEWSFKPEVEGEYSIQVVAEDNLGNQTRTVLTVFAEKKAQEAEAQKQEELEADLAAQQDDPNKKEMTFDA